MPKPRIKARVDENQSAIVAALRSIPGVSVEVDHDDCLCGYMGRTYWYEIKRPEEVGKDGKIKQSRIKPSQKKLLATWKGHYRIVWTLGQILEDMGIE